MERQQDNRLLSIGKMARCNGVTPRALRVYQREGLLEPAYVDEENGNRYYDIFQSRRVDMIHELQNIGFSIDEIKEVDAEKDLAGLAKRAQRHLDDIERRQHDLAVARAAAAELVESCRRFDDGGLLNQIVLENLPERHILTFDVPEGLDFSSGNRDIETQWEWMLRLVKLTILEKGYPRALFRRVGSAVRLADVERGIPQSSYAFVFVDKTFGPCFEESTPIPPGLFLSLYCTDAYVPEEGIGMGAHSMARLLDYARAKDLVPVGDYYQEVVCRWPCLFGQSGKMLCRLHIPVRRAS